MRVIVLRSTTQTAMHYALKAIALQSAVMVML